MGVVNIIATIGANLCIDRVGRKVLLYISNTGMIVSLSVFGTYFYMKDAMMMEAPGKSLNLNKAKVGKKLSTLHLKILTLKRDKFELSENDCLLL